MSVGQNNDGRPYVVGAAAGLVAWLVGYVLTYLLSATELDDSLINRFVQFAEGDSATYELVGWVFYNAHFVSIRYVNVPISLPQNFVGGEDGFSVVLFVVPPLLLFAAGLAIGRYRGIADTAEGAITGALVVPGYLVLSVAGVFLFEVTVGDASGAPALLPALVLAGLLYPAVFGALGGVVAAATTDEQSVLS
ncbi:hypothetical protein [Natronomonas marina]|jgi:hypothetical protein|uniref:hypothetical protein n=1 Tax=Natronomonas marina TaxID=2961939 RepID=UPI0020C98762|nr:hypothetical protein [Natronomonas marina]